MTGPGSDVEPTAGAVPDVSEHEWLSASPTAVTESARAFLASFFQTFRLFNRTVALALRADWVAHIADSALNAKPRIAETPEELAQKAPGPVTQGLRKDSQALIEMILSRLVDHFTTYLSEVLREALRARPEMLRSQEQVRVDYLLQFATMDELREDMVDRKVLELSYLGFTDLENWCSSRMSIQLAPEAGVRNALIELLETRNLIVHNRSRIGVKYLRVVADSKFRLGELRVLDADTLFETHKLLFALVKHVDDIVSTKYCLPRAPYKRLGEPH